MEGTRRLLGFAILLVVSPFVMQVHVQARSYASTPPFRSMVLDACRATQYPEECKASFSAHAEFAFGEQTGFSTGAVSSALSGVGSYYSFTSNLQGKAVDVRERYSFSACLETLQDSQGEMSESLTNLGTVNPGNFKSLMTDVLTSLSAALTYHTTCIDGWDNSPGPTRDTMIAQGSSSQKLVANAVSIVSNLVGTFNRETSNQNRRLLSDPSEQKSAYQMDGEYPQWLEGGMRHLLQDNSNLTVYNAIVAQDGTGQYRTVQDAVNNAPRSGTNNFVIKIKQGVYYEMVTIPSKVHHVMFVGDGMGNTIISGSKSVMGSNVTTFQTATVAVNGRGFVARDITFRNTAGAANHQAVAARISSDKSAFLRVGFEGYQDTLYAHTKRQFYKDCKILGTIDFVFGNAAAVFQSCSLLLREPLPGQFNTVTAQGRTIPEQNTGFSFQQCYVGPAPDLAQALNTQPIQSYLGRPWKLYSRTVYLETYMAYIINPQGWSPWNGTFALNTLFYGEYKNSGPGSSFNQRVKWATQIFDPNVAKQYTVAFVEGSEWLPQTKVYFQGQL